MIVRKGPARAALVSTLASAILAVATASPAGAAASTPPFEPDSNAAGSISFYDAAGNVVTSGAADQPVGFAVGSTDLAGRTSSKANLYGYLPKSGQAPGQFSGEQLAGPTTFPVAGAPSPVASSPNPVVQPTGTDLTFADLAKDFPNTAPAGDPYEGLYAIRIKVSGVAQYLATDIQVVGNTWSQVYPAGQPTAPAAPTGVRAGSGDQQVVLSWTAPASGGQPITSYKVTSTPAGGTPTTVDTASTATSYTVTGLTNGTSYAFTVAAANSLGTGPQSSSVSATPAYASTLTLRTTAGVTVAGQYFRLYGQLTSGPASAKRLVLYSYPAGHAASTYAFTSSSTGSYTLNLHPYYTTVYRVVYAGDASHKAAASGLLRVYVRTRVSISSPPNGYKTHTRTLAVTGTTTPNKAGQVVNLYEYRSGTAVLLARVKVASNGTFRFVRTFAKGTHVFVVTIGATTTNASGRSARTTLYEV